MSRILLTRISLGALFLCGCWLAYTQNAAAPAALTVNKVKDDLYEIVGDGGNVAVYITDEGVIMVDDKYGRDSENILAKVKSITSQPIKYILSTHHHEDHSGGNVNFIANTQIISTANARKNIVDRKQSNAAGKMVGAQIVFTDQSSVFLGGKEVRAYYFGRGHTNGDAVIYFPAIRTIHTGDLMAGSTPLIDYPGGGSVVEWTKTLDAAMKLDFDTVIPGHGDVTTKDKLLSYRNNVEKLRDRAAGLIRQGKSQEDVGKVMVAEFGWQAGGLQMQWSLPGMMTELK